MRKLLAISILLFSTILHAQEWYGLMDFASNDYYPKDGIVEEFKFLDPGMTGDILQHNGLMEGTWE